MLRYSFVACTFALISTCRSRNIAVKRWDDLQVKHAWAEVPRGWELHSAAPEDYRFDMRISLKQDKFDDLVTALYEVSDPAHAKYVYRPPLHLHATVVDVHPMQIRSASFKGGC